MGLKWQNIVTILIIVVDIVLWIVNRFMQSKKLVYIPLIVYFSAAMFVEFYIKEPIPKVLNVNAKCQCQWKNQAGHTILVDKG